MVERTLRSLAAQTYEDFIAIVWDDASSDSTWNELQRVAKLLSDPRIMVLREEQNIGMTAGFKKYSDLADSVYVAIVGSGDECFPSRLAEQVAALDEDWGASFVATATETIDEVTGNSFRDETHRKRYVDNGDLTRAVPFTHGSVMYRAENLKGVGGYDTRYKWCSDWDLFHRLLKASRGIYLNKVLYRRYARLDGVSYNPEKSLEQIRYKYLVALVDSSPESERDAILSAAAKDLKKVVSVFEREIARDLSRRRVKLHFMGRHRQADDLGRIIKTEYHSAFSDEVQALMARVLGSFGLAPDRLITAARSFASK
ncbi:glycosyltransferase [Ideonella sp. 4Y11]|uniref:Glycosyltransferase n=1 Tax=Ideonella aquatica TaxID=2824119 RepID=A0A941BLP2_9BURK|nr:glycosyltransferase [Ideonella aquatica]